MLLHHYSVDALGVLECQESEASGPTCCAITHHSTLADLAKLREILLQRLYINNQLTVIDGEARAVIVGNNVESLTLSSLPVQSTNEHLAVHKC